ncbi:MAG TPA: glycoside hydrolase family 3 C-terminal domain-containing protein [Fimbriimonas sp.]
MTFLGTLLAASFTMIEHPFQNPELPTEKRIDNLLSMMTLDEKIACLSTDPSVPRLGVKGSRHVEGLHGLAQGGPANWSPPRKVPTTTFPQSYGLGQTWDTDLIQRVAAAEGLECRYVFQSPNYGQGGLVLRAPNSDLGRDPRWGRTEECFGEDPFLAGSLTRSFVRGLQGDHPKYWQAASLMKHFLANSCEDERDFGSSDFDERLWREYYSVPFRMGVEAGSRAYMASYNAVNGTPMHVHPDLKTITVQEWGQDGIICTDGGGYNLLVTAHKAFATHEEAAAAVIKAGIGQFLDRYVDGTRAALAKGLLEERDLDAVLRGNFRVMIKLGLLDPSEAVPYSKIGQEPEPWQSEEHRALALEATRKSIVLLKNENETLPLDRERLKKVAVLGLRSDEVILDWYSGMPPYRITPLEGIRRELGAEVEVAHALEGPEAVRLAREADVAIVVVGNHPTGNAGWAKVERRSDGKEAVDRQSIDLEDEDLIRQVLAANPRTIVVLTSSFPYAINWTEANVPAILHMAHGSQEQGTALADVLFGDVNPAGRLTQTWVRSVGDLPPITDYDLRKGRTYLYFRGEPLYRFGHGLSYTRFEYADLAIEGTETLRVGFNLTNAGTRDGEEVAQLYVRHLDSKVARPIKELRAFQRTMLKKGETRRIELSVRVKDLACWDPGQRRWVVEEGRVEIQVGRSSRDVALRQTLSIGGRKRTAREQT